MQEYTTQVSSLYNAYRNDVFGIAYYYLREKEAAKDVAMEVFKKLTEHLRKNTKIENEKGWLLTVAKNTALNRIKKAKSQATEELMVEELPEQDYSDGAAVQNLKEEILLDTLAELKFDQRRCLELFYLHRYKYQDISRMLNMNDKNVKSHIQNGKRKLKILLSAKFERLNE